MGALFLFPFYLPLPPSSLSLPLSLPYLFSPLHLTLSPSLPLSLFLSPSLSHASSHAKKTSFFLMFTAYWHIHLPDNDRRSRKQLHFTDNLQPPCPLSGQGTSQVTNNPSLCPRGGSELVAMWLWTRGLEAFISYSAGDFYPISPLA